MPAPRKSTKGGYPVARKRRPAISRQVREIDHKNIALLKRYINEFGALESRRRSGNAPATQRMIATAVKRARILALLPFVKR
jgi:small subunit ribosomal protein S18